MNKFPSLLKPIIIGNIPVKNRMMIAAHSYGYVDDNGLPTEQLLDYVEERAKGGAGVIVLGGTSISFEGALVERILINSSSNIIPWYKKISERVHKHNALILDQLEHIGGQLDSYDGSRIVAPSPIPHEICNSIPLELNVDEIKKIIQAFGQAAHRDMVGGIDGIELKCDQGFLINQFLSPYYNRRTDEYGGSDKNRTRFLVELIHHIRSIIGTQKILGIRISGDSLTPGDLSIEEMVTIIKDVQKLGSVDYISINGGTNSTYPAYLQGHGDSSIAAMNFLPFSKKIKEITTIPVAIGSMINSPLEAEYILSSGYADIVAMTRPHIADPEIINKVLENRIDDIRPCILCNQSCVGNHWKGADIHCIHNPAAGREKELGIGTILKSKKSKLIGVVGGGPAGLEFARVAALRGHQVILFEKSRELGGQALIASKFPYRQGFKDIIHYLERQALKAKVQINKGAPVSSNDILEAKEFDAWVIATGAKSYIPPIYGELEKEHILNIENVADKNMHPSAHVLIVNVDWRQNGLAVANKLIQDRCKVTIISPSFFVGDGLDVVTLTSYYARLENYVHFLPSTVLDSYADKTAHLRNVLSNRNFELSDVDYVVFIHGKIPSNELFIELQDKHPNLYKIGDCHIPRGVPDAILDASRLARKI